jgi:branched-chain amino acid transport system ATP-binding protein
MASPAPLLSAQGLRKDFGGLHVVRDMSLTLEIGQILGVIGPNGAGKSTLFNLLSGSLPLNAGRITLDGTDLTHAPAEARLRAGLGRTFQIPRPFPRMTLLENTLTAAQNQPGEGVLTALFAPRRVRAVEAENTARAHDILSFLSLDHLANQPAAVLSGGQRKLLELARVMMANPRVILLDEPAAGVNPALLDLIIDRIQAINAQGVAILLIEHNMEMITRLCPQVIVMAAGAKLAEGTPAEVSARPDVIDVYLEGMPA